MHMDLALHPEPGVLPPVGRQAELARVTAALRRGRSALVLGAPGLGKTHLATAAVSEAGATGSAAWTVATASLRTVDYGALGWLLPGRTPEHPAEAVAGLTAALEARAGRHRPLLVVDDAHLLDERSADVLLQLATAGTVTVLATALDVALPPGLEALADDRYGERVELGSFDRDATGALAAALLDGVVAEATVESLWRWSGGVPLVVVALVEEGRRADRFHLRRGRWWWEGPGVVPRRAAGHLAAALAALEPSSQDAFDLLVVAEALAPEPFEALAGAAALDELEASGLIRFVRRGAGTMVLPTHPVLAEHRRDALGAARRRRLAARLLDHVPADADDAAALVLRAFWRVEAGRHTADDRDLVLRAASVVQLSDPGAAATLVEAAHAAEPGARTWLARVALHIEVGERERAWRAWEDARRVADPDDDALAAALRQTEVELHLWADHDPEAARRAIARARSRATSAAETQVLDSIEALTWLLSARPAQARAGAEAVLATEARSVDGFVGATLVRLVGLVLTGHTTEALAAGPDALAVAEAAAAEQPSVAGMIRAALALARVWRGELDAVPAVHPATGRWPVPPTTHPDAAGLRWPVMAGIVAHLQGDLEAAIARLEEGVVQHRGGKRMFHAEAVAWLAVTLCEAGRPADAEVLLEREPMGAIRLFPGLTPWVQGALLAARGDQAGSARAWCAAADEAAAAGATLLAVRYLADAVSAGAPPPAADRLRALLGGVDAPLLAAIGRAALAVAAGDGAGLLDEALEHERLGLRRRSLALANRATGLRRDANDLVARLRRSLAGADEGRVDTTVFGLTVREREVAELAATGMSDREIAAKLIVSVRTVESHLASSYRKLGIASRRELAALLG